MKRLVLLGEGHGDHLALPVLIRKLLQEKGPHSQVFVDRDVIRSPPTRLVRWHEGSRQATYSEWIRRVELAARRREVGAVLAVYDGDLPSFPPGAPAQFCAATAAKGMAAAAVTAGAGKMFSLSVVFACSEYETWLVAGAESLAGRRLKDGRPALPTEVCFPAGDPESHGKRWLLQNCPNYRPARDQAPLTELLDPKIVRAKGVRSFRRLEHALHQLLNAVATGHHISTPA